MITDARVLQQEFIPREVQHRDNEVNYLSSILEPITDGQSAEPILLYGPSGTGKTCIAQFILERLRENVVELDSQYVNCWEDYTRFKTLYQLLDGVGKTYDIHRQSTPRDLLVDRLRDYDGPHYVVILDEVDQLQSKDILYDLYRIPNLSIILIANSEEDLFSPLDDRVRSRLQNAHRIHFDQYGDNELASILRDRTQWGLTEGAITENGLYQIADRAAGDARVAIGILRKAAREASQANDDHITSETIVDVVLEAKMEIKQKTLDRLTPDQKTLYSIITDAEEITPPALYDQYQQQVDDPKTERTVRNYLAKLAQYNLIVMDGNTKARVYRAKP